MKVDNMASTMQVWQRVIVWTIVREGALDMFSLAAIPFYYSEADGIMGVKGSVVDMLVEKVECYRALESDNGALSETDFIICPNVCGSESELSTADGKHSASVMQCMQRLSERNTPERIGSKVGSYQRTGSSTWKMPPPTWRKLGRTERGHWGIFQWNAQVGDKICLLPLATYPFVIRPVEHLGKPCYELICETFTSALMEIEVDPEQKEWITLC